MFLKKVEQYVMLLYTPIHSSSIAFLYLIEVEKTLIQWIFYLIFFSLYTCTYVGGDWVVIYNRDR